MVPVENLSREVRPGLYGILEPLSDLPALSPALWAAPNTVWLVPGMAFDLSGNRLGRGQGYYDRLLKAPPGRKIGIAFHWQIVDELPIAPGDVKMDLIVTDVELPNR